MLDAAFGAAVVGTLLLHDDLERLLAADAATNLISQGVVGRSKTVDRSKDGTINLTLKMLGLVLEYLEKADQGVGIAKVAVNDIRLLAAAETLLECSVINLLVIYIKTVLELVDVIDDSTPARFIIAAILGLGNVDHLLNLVGEFMEVLANPFLGKNMARLDRMLMVDVVDVFMGMEMLVLMLVIPMMVLVHSMVMLSVVLVLVVFVVVAFANLL